jgi:hypothetical protein
MSDELDQIVLAIMRMREPGFRAGYRGWFSEGYRGRKFIDNYIKDYSCIIKNHERENLGKTNITPDYIVFKNDGVKIGLEVTDASAEHDNAGVVAGGLERLSQELRGILPCGRWLLGASGRFRRQDVISAVKKEVFEGDNWSLVREGDSTEVEIEINRPLLFIHDENDLKELVQGRILAKECKIDRWCPVDKRWLLVTLSDYCNSPDLISGMSFCWWKFEKIFYICDYMPNAEHEYQIGELKRNQHID